MLHAVDDLASTHVGAVVVVIDCEVQKLHTQMHGLLTWVFTGSLIANDGYNSSRTYRLLCCQELRLCSPTKATPKAEKT